MIQWGLFLKSKDQTEFKGRFEVQSDSDIQDSQNLSWEPNLHPVLKNWGHENEWLKENKMNELQIKCDEREQMSFINQTIDFLDHLLDWKLKIDWIQTFKTLKTFPGHQTDTQYSRIEMSFRHENEWLEDKS